MMGAWLVLKCVVSAPVFKACSRSALPAEQSANPCPQPFPASLGSLEVDGHGHLDEAWSSVVTIDANTIANASPGVLVGARALVPARRTNPRPTQSGLLDLYRRSCLGKLLLDGLRFVLGDPVFDGLRSSVHQVLGFL